MRAVQHKYVQPDPTRHTDEAGYRVVEGVVVDDTEHVKSSAARYSDRYHRPTREELLAEEAAWAARSGPVTVRRVHTGR